MNCSSGTNRSLPSPPHRIAVINFSIRFFITTARMFIQNVHKYNTIEEGGGIQKKREKDDGKKERKKNANCKPLYNTVLIKILIS